jgi:hypothetical protein
MATPAGLDSFFEELSANTPGTSTSDPIFLAILEARPPITS